MGDNRKLRLKNSGGITVPRSAAPRRGHRDDPVRTSAAGSIVVFSFGIILMLAALAGGFILSWRARLVSVDDAPNSNVVDIAQVCATVKQHNIDYPKRVSDALRKGISDTLAGDQAAGDKATADMTAIAKEWTGKLRSDAGQTDNAALGKALTDLADKLKPVETGDASLNDMNAIVEDGNTAIAKHCPQATPTATPTA
jgi:hypothetical protein